jgi:uncharacterized protein (DUF1810 family)
MLQLESNKVHIVDSLKAKPMDLSRFLEAQKNTYALALKEIQHGRKTGHWIWYVFPQIKGLGRSSTSKFYGISSCQEAKEYLNHEILGKRLRDIIKAFLTHKNSTANQILGFPDDLKVRSSMTLFEPFDKVGENIFTEAIDQFYQGLRCEKTLEFLKDC